MSEEDQEDSYSSSSSGFINDNMEDEEDY